MSGGHFEYQQYRITEIANSIQDELDKQGKQKPQEQLYMGGGYYDIYPNEKYYTTYQEEIQEKIREGVKFLKLAYVYAQRIDWFLSGDDGDEDFLRKLEEDIKQIENDSDVQDE